MYFWLSILMFSEVRGIAFWFLSNLFQARRTGCDILRSWFILRAMWSFRAPWMTIAGGSEQVVESYVFVQWTNISIYYHSISSWSLVGCTPKPLQGFSWISGPSIWTIWVEVPGPTEATQPIRTQLRLCQNLVEHLVSSMFLHFMFLHSNNYSMSISNGRNGVYCILCPKTGQVHCFLASQANTSEHSRPGGPVLSGSMGSQRVAKLHLVKNLTGAGKTNIPVRTNIPLLSPVVKLLDWYM